MQPPSTMYFDTIYLIGVFYVASTLAITLLVYAFGKIAIRKKNIQIIDVMGYAFLGLVMGALIQLIAQILSHRSNIMGLIIVFSMILLFSIIPLFTRDKG
jgi:steroid 5-alpha reductase family enzyme